MKKYILLSLLIAFAAQADTPPPVDGLKLKYGTQSGLVNTSNGSPSVLSCGSNTGYVPTWSGSVFSCAALPASGVTSVGATSPLASSGGATPTITIQNATSLQTGALTSTDWATFNGKQDALGFTAVPNTRTVNGHALSANVTVTASDVGLGSVTNAAQVTGVTATAPIASSGGTAPVISCIAATGSVAGCLSAADWTTFNAKVASTRAINTTAPLAGGGDLSADRTLTCNVASGSQPGCLASADWTTFNNKQATGLTVLKAGDTMTGALVNSFAGTASTPGILVSGAPFTGGTATTTKPQLSVDSGGTSNNWQTTGTMVGVNAPNAFAGYLADFQVNGTRAAFIDSTGLYGVTQSGETVVCGMTSGGGRYSCNNSTHSNSTFEWFAPNTGYLGFGEQGSFPNDWYFSVTGSSANTTPATSLAPNAVAAGMVVLRNNTSQAGNYNLIGSSGTSDKLTSAIVMFNDVHTASSEQGHVELMTTVAGTRAMKMRLAAKGQVSYSGTAPTVATCGTSPAVVGTDNAARVTIGTGGSATACTLTFNDTWTNAPICQVRDETTGESLKGVPSTTALTFSRQAGGAFGASDSIAVNCAGYY